uniref:RIMS-binding protein 2-like n=1 Tax=Panthera onca TaxID=9690 RepID=UPI00295388DF|nr:RIMS-binding protein 2-like [Panthera onca]
MEGKSVALVCALETSNSWQLGTDRPKSLGTRGCLALIRVQGDKLGGRGQPVTSTLCGQVAEVISPVADSAAVELVRLRSLEARAVTVRTLSAQGESADSAFAAIPPDLLVPPTPHPRTAPTPKPLASAGAPDTKEEHPGPHIMADEAWEQSRAPAPAHGHMLEPPSMQGSGPGRRSPSPSRILPQPQGTPVSTSVAKAMAREAAQRVAESSRLEKRSIFLERGGSLYVNSDEEDGYGSPDVKRRGASVDDFLRGSELGKQVSVDWGPRRPPLASVPWPLQGQGHPRPWGRRRHPARLRHLVGLGALDVTVPVRL